MAGQFEPQVIQGSSLRGESFIKPPSVSVPASAVSTLVEGATTAYGVYNMQKAAKQIDAEQTSFLEDFSNLQNENVAAEGMLANAGDEAVYNSFKNQYETFSSAAKSGRLNPTEAMGRIEDAKRRAIARAPMFAKQIKSLSGSKGTEFDAVTSQLIKERNDLRDKAVSFGLDANNPIHLDMTREMMSAESEAKFISSNKEVYGYKFGKVANKLLDIQIFSVENRIQETIKAHGGVENAPEPVLSEIGEFLQSFMNGNEKTALRRFFDQPGSPISSNDLTDKDFDRMADQMRASAEAQYKVINRGIPKEIAGNTLAMAGDQEMLRFWKEDPYGFFVHIMSSKAPADSVAGRAVSEETAKTIMRYIKSKRDGKDSTSDLKSKDFTPEEIAMVKKNSAETKMGAADFFKNTPMEKQDPVFRKEYFEVLSGDVTRAAADVHGYTTKEHEANLELMSNEATLRALEESNPDTYEKFIYSSGEYIKKYSERHLGNDMYNQLLKDVTVSNPTGTGRHKTKNMLTSQAVKAVITNGGGIVFQPRDEYSGDAEVLKSVRDLNNKYRSPVNKVSRAVANITDIGKAAPSDVTLRLFKNALNQSGIAVEVDKSWDFGGEE